MNFKIDCTIELHKPDVEKMRRDAALFDLANMGECKTAYTLEEAFLVLFHEGAPLDDYCVGWAINSEIPMDPDAKWIAEEQIAGHLLMDAIDGRT